MIVWWCLLLSILAQFTSAQTIPYGVPNRSLSNARIFTNGIPTGRGLPNGMANNAIRRPLSANNIGKGNFMNRQNYANAYYANNYLPNKANNNMIKSNLANVRPNIVEPTFATPVMPASSQVLTNDITTTAIENLANGNVMANVATTGMPKVTNLNFGSNPIPVTVVSGNHGNLPVGIQILADNLEVRGTVSVAGRMPIYGAVTINGSVPTDGKASVNYSCGSPGVI